MTPGGYAHERDLFYADIRDPAEARTLQLATSYQQEIESSTHLTSEEYAARCESILRELNGMWPHLGYPITVSGNVMEHAVRHQLPSGTDELGSGLNVVPQPAENGAPLVHRYGLFYEQFVSNGFVIKAVQGDPSDPVPSPQILHSLSRTTSVALTEVDPPVRHTQHVYATPDLLIHEGAETPELVRLQAKAAFPETYQLLAIAGEKSTAAERLQAIRDIDLSQIPIATTEQDRIHALQSYIYNVANLEGEHMPYFALSSSDDIPLYTVDNNGMQGNMRFLDAGRRHIVNINDLAILAVKYLGEDGSDEPELSIALSARLLSPDPQQDRDYSVFLHDIETIEDGRALLLGQAAKLSRPSA